MKNISKLPKWAQEYISELQSTQSLTGANIENVNVETVGFKHDENSQKAIESVASALAENAKALGILSAALTPKNIDVSIGSAISLNNISAK